MSGRTSCGPSMTVLAEDRTLVVIPVTVSNGSIVPIRSVLDRESIPGQAVKQMPKERYKNSSSPICYIALGPSDGERQAAYLQLFMARLSKGDIEAIRAAID
jgi:hypothetical protein